jgi:hypothetical protein
MRLWSFRFAVLVSLSVCAATLTGTSATAVSAAQRSLLASAQHAAQAGIWGNAEEVPGTASLNGDGHAAVDSISCSSPGNCSAGGYYIDSSAHDQVFVVDETGGVWGTAEELPGLGTLNTGGYAALTSISCSSPGNCSAGGYYTLPSAAYEAFVADETGGVWGNAEEVPGSATIGTGYYAAVSALSCSSAGNCSAGGSYTSTAAHYQAFVVNEVGGTWGDAAAVASLPTLNAGNSANVDSLSCPSNGNCSAGGGYKDSSGHVQLYVVDETGGTWGDAAEVPGSATLNAGGSATLSAISCASAGNCSAVGSYKDSSGHTQVYVVGESSGTWGDTAEVPGTATLNAGGMANLYSVSCASAGNCSAGGYYDDSSGKIDAFVADENGGSWGSAEVVPGSATLAAGGLASLTSISCPSAGNCSAGGYYADASGNSQVFVVNEAGGTWGNAGEVPGSATLNADGSAEVTSVSCSSAGSCSAGGYYKDGSAHLQAFVVDYTPSPTVTGLSPASGPAHGGTVVTVSGTNFAGTTAVDFGTKAGMKMSVVNADTLKVTAPAGTGTVNVTVTTRGGSSGVSTKDRFSYFNPPTVTRLSPASGPARGGSIVTISGTNLVGASAVHFGAKTGAHLTVVNPDTVKVTAPAGTGTVNVTVTTPGGTSAVSTKDRFSYLNPPTVTKLSPASGSPHGGAVIIVYGTHLTGASAVHFGTKAGTHVTVVNADALKVTTPAGTGTVNVTVTTPGGTSAVSTKDRYSYT